MNLKATSKPSNQKIGILLIAIDNQNSTYIKATIKNKEEYATKHDYDLITIQKGDAKVEPVWMKIKMLKQYIQNYEWLWVIDSDAFVINMNITLESRISKAMQMNNQTILIISKDCNEINAGSFLVRNDPTYTPHFLNIWYAMKDTTEGKHVWKEQNILIHMKNYNVFDFNDRVTYLEQSELQSLPVANYCGAHYKEGDFVIHFISNLKPMIGKKMRSIYPHLFE